MCLDSESPACYPTATLLTGVTSHTCMVLSSELKAICWLSGDQARIPALPVNPEYVERGKWSWINVDTDVYARQIPPPTPAVASAPTPISTPRRRMRRCGRSLVAAGVVEGRMSSLFSIMPGLPFRFSPSVLAPDSWHLTMPFLVDF